MSAREGSRTCDRILSETPDEDRVVRPSSLQTPAHAVRLDEESVIAQPVLELHVVPRGPDRVDSALPEGSARAREPGVA